MRKSIPISTSLTPAQIERLYEWGSERNLTDPAAILRAALHVAIPDLGDNPPPHGGFRGGRAPLGGTVVLLADYGQQRTGTTGVVERRTRHGAEVAFGTETVVVPYRLLSADG